MPDMLTETRKADREKMVAEVMTLAREMGAAATISDWFPKMHPRGVMIDIEGPRGLQISVDFDGQSAQPDTFVMCWHISTDSDARFADAFGHAWPGGTINPHHFGKSTWVAYGFPDLCRALRVGLDMARAGSAFDAGREAAAIAKDGTAAERAARWAKWRAEMTAI